MKYAAIINTPGYLPDREPEVFDTAREAWEYLYDEREAEEFDAEVVTDSATVRALTWRIANGGTGTVTGPTPGYDGEHDLGVAYTVDEVRS